MKYERSLLNVTLCLCIFLSLVWGCTEQRKFPDIGHPSQTELPPIVETPETRESIELTSQARGEHRRVMLQHLESIQQIVAALGRGDFERAQGLTELHLGFFMHRQAMARQKPEDFPPAYHDLAMAHHEAAEELAQIMPSRDMKKILPKLDGVLKACVGCHLAFKLMDEGELSLSPGATR